MALEALGIEALETHDGHPVKLDELEGKILGLFFSASWCPPCVAFSPVLNEFAEKNKADFAVILVGHDHRQEDFDEYTKHKTAFYRIPWSDRSKRDQISSAFNIYALPTLQIISPKGESLTSFGKLAVTSNPDGCIEGWKNGGMGLMNRCSIM